MKTSIQLTTLLLFAAPLVSAVAQYASYPAGVDPSKKYWPPGTGPPSKRWLHEFITDDPENPGHSLNPHHHGLGFASIPKLSLLSTDESILAEKFYWDRLPHAPPIRRSFIPPQGSGLFKRAGRFECASGTNSCSAVGQESFCCDQGTACVTIPDTGYGTIGCCPSGQSCSGPLTGCGANKLTCSDAEGGGCCNKGSVCSPMGCKPADEASATTTTATKSACTKGYYACPTNVAGGCCPSGRLCGVSDCPAPAATASLGCPDGFRTCAEEFSGGCCRQGRGCGVTDCPALDAAILTTTNTAAAAAAAENTASEIIQGAAGGVLGGTLTTTAGGNAPAKTTQAVDLCPTGWNACALAAGGGCCPNGYECGIANCPARTLVGSGQTTVLVATAKEPQNTFFVNSNSNSNSGSRKFVEKRIIIMVGAAAVAGGMAMA